MLSLLFLARCEGKRSAGRRRAATCLTLVLFRLDEFWFSDGSLSDKSKCADPGLMPLPDAGTGLDWSHLVDAARAFEGKDSRPPGRQLGGRLCSRGVWADVPDAHTSVRTELSRRGCRCD